MTWAQAVGRHKKPILIVTLYVSGCAVDHMKQSAFIREATINLWAEDPRGGQTAELTEAAHAVAEAEKWRWRSPRGGVASWDVASQLRRARRT